MPVVMLLYLQRGVSRMRGGQLVGEGRREKGQGGALEVDAVDYDGAGVQRQEGDESLDKVLQKYRE